MNKKLNNPRANTHSYDYYSTKNDFNNNSNRGNIFINYYNNMDSNNLYNNYNHENYYDMKNNSIKMNFEDNINNNILSKSSNNNQGIYSNSLLNIKNNNITNLNMIDNKYNKVFK